MTTQQIRLVHETFQHISHLAPETVGGVFYQRLFEIAPEVKPLFHQTTMLEQSVKLVTILSFIIAQLNELDTLLPKIKDLARRHERYGVQEGHYALVGAALLWTLEQALNHEWTPDVQDAWTACYNTLAQTMLEAV